MELSDFCLRSNFDEAKTQKYFNTVYLYVFNVNNNEWNTKRNYIANHWNYLG